MADRCSSCYASVLWVRNVKSGTRLILDAEPLDTSEGLKPGMVGVVPGGEKGRILTKRDLDDGQIRDGLDPHPEIQWHLSHFATCPFADSHVRR